MDNTSTNPSLIGSFYTLNEWCEKRRCGRTTAYKEIKAGRLKAHKFGGRTVIKCESDEEFVSNLPTLDLCDKIA